MRDTPLPIVVYGTSRTPRLATLLRDRLPNVEVREYDATASLTVMSDAEIVITRAGPFIRDLPAAAGRLQWLHSTAAGVDELLVPDLVMSSIMVTNSRGCYGETIANHVLAFLFALLRRLPQTFTLQHAHQWRYLYEGDEIQGKTSGIVGFGSIGRVVAARLHSLGIPVLAADIAPPPPDTPCDGFFDTSRGLPPEFLARIDVLILTCPLTPQTRSLVNATTLRQMKRSAFLINVARGAVVEERDLIAALREGAIAGAALDVFAEEPLSPTSPLWDLPNVIATPHMAGNSAFLELRIADLVAENYRRYITGQPLRNVVDKRAGF